MAHQNKLHPLLRNGLMQNSLWTTQIYISTSRIAWSEIILITLNCVFLKTSFFSLIESMKMIMNVYVDYSILILLTIFTSVHVQEYLWLQGCGHPAGTDSLTGPLPFQRFEPPFPGAHGWHSSSPAGAWMHTRSPTLCMAAPPPTLLQMWREGKCVQISYQMQHCICFKTHVHTPWTNTHYVYTYVAVSCHITIKTTNAEMWLHVKTCFSVNRISRVFH